ncbi:MAG: chromosomal replication initiator protein DnaA [Acholeplasmatales bacterium]|nr:chromosomal replication initiator protein DnaA [Acholeplasmatales bacterium]
MEKVQIIWSDLLSELSKNYDSELLSEVFDDCQIVKETNGLIHVLVPSVYVKSKINNVFYNNINKLLPTICDKPVRFKFLTKEDLVKEENKYEEKLIVQQTQSFESNLNGLYTFDSFIVGDSNRFAQRNALITAQQPGTVNNPLYIFGGVGLGKTHLMQAIGNYYLDANVGKNVLYITTQNFIKEYSLAAKNKELDKFDEKFNNLDMLLIDDIQMISSAPKTQEAFFNIFVNLTNNNKQIIITSDKPANQLNNIMDRLTTRFNYGLTVDISTPDIPLKCNILKYKLSQSSPASIEDNVIEYISTLFDNIRELEGCLRRVLAYADISNEDVTLDLAKEALSSIISNKQSSDSNDQYENVKSIICDFYNITVSDIVGKKRTSNIVVPRQLCMYILRNKYDLPYTKIGELMGHKDHSTVMTAVSKIDNELNSNDDLKLSYEAVLKKLSLN